MGKAARPPRSFGPAVVHEPDGTFRASCTWCHFRIHTSCTHKKPPQTIPDPANTPDWCDMRAGMLADVKAAAE